MALLHHLARTGGTLISRCLSSMSDVCLLSEIHPAGTDYFNPLRQAADWHGLIRGDEVHSFKLNDRVALHAAIDRIAELAGKQNRQIVVRDWSHLDWIGFPFVYPPPMCSAWDDLTSTDGGRGVPNPANPAPNNLAWRLHRCATVRHPVDQYRSTKKLSLLDAAWDEVAFWKGTRSFAEAIQAMPWFRYEDFLTAPSQTLRQICDALGIVYDPAWEQRWYNCVQVTGDGADPNRKSVRPTERSPVESGFWNRLRDNQDLRATLELFGLGR